MPFANSSLWFNFTIQSFWTNYWLAHLLAVGILSVCSFEALRRSSFLLGLVRSCGEHGKTVSSSGIFWVPKRLFLHFYIVGFIINCIILWLKPSGISCLYHIQVSRRLYESLFVTKWSQFSQMNIAHYFLGVSYYIAAPLTIMSCLDAAVSAKTKVFWFYSLLFLIGNYIQYKCHLTLAQIRVQPTEVQETRYAIPHGHLFEFVSCPHYAAEITIYGLLVLLSGNSPQTISLFVFVFSELTFSAYSQHKWYRVKFEDYPLKRYAIFYGFI